MTLGIFLILPFTQQLSPHAEHERRVIKIDEVSLTTPTRVAKELIKQAQTPRMTLIAEPKKKPIINLDSLSIPLKTKPGFQENHNLISQLNFAKPDWKDLVFKINELDKTPKTVKQGALNYPYKMKRKKIEGRVELLVEINPLGRVKVLKVLKSTHAAFDKSAIKCAEETLYEAPIKDGMKVTTQFRLPVMFSLQK